MSHCCGCMATSTAGIIGAGKSQLELIEEELTRVGGRKDVFLGFVLKWDNGSNGSSDIDSWMIEPSNGDPDQKPIGYNTGYKGTVSGTQTYNYVLERKDVTVDWNNSLLSPNKGNLDKDSISDAPPQIENLVYFDKDRMSNGLYKYRIDDFANNHPNGFEVYIIKRHPTTLQPEGFAKLVWEGEFSHTKQLRENAQDMVHFCKQGDRLTFKVMHPRLKIKETKNLDWTTGNLNCSGSGSSTPSRPLEEWRAEHTDVAREDNNFTWTERTSFERKYVNGSRTSETRNSRTEQINRQPKVKWVRERTSSRNAVEGNYRNYYVTYCEVKYSGGQKTQETRNCQETLDRSERIFERRECTISTPQYCHHDRPDDPQRS